MEKSRNEQILESILSGEYNFSSPQSRNEALLIALGEKLKDIDTPSEDVIRQAVTDWLNENPVEVVSGGDPLAGKKILFVGDSICYGVGLGSGQHPYPYWIGQNHSTATIINDSVGGQTIAYQNPDSGQSLGVKCRDDRYGADTYSGTDIIVIEGGVNDLMRNITFGTLKQAYMNKRDAKYRYSINTYAGALEFVFEYFTRKFPSAKIYFTTIHRLISATSEGKQWAYWECASEACAKWGIGFIDLFHNIPTELTGTDLHPNNATHKDWYAPLIDDVLCGRKSYPVSTARTYYGKYITNMGALIQKPNYTTNEFKVGDTFSQSNWRINSGGYNGAQGANVTSKVTWDLSELPMTADKVLTTEGTFYVYGWANLDGVFCDCFVPVYVSANESSGGDDTPTDPSVELTGIGASKTKTTYNVGDTLTTNDITVTGTYTDGSQRDLTSVATVNTSGVNMSTPGSYTITVSVEGGYNATISIIVEASAEPEDWEKIVELSIGSRGNIIELWDYTSTIVSGSTVSISFDYELTATDADGNPITSVFSLGTYPRFGGNMNTGAIKNNTNNFTAKYTSGSRDLNYPANKGDMVLASWNTTYNYVLKMKNISVTITPPTT